MISTLRAGLLAGAMLASVTPAEAQSLFGDFWSDPPRRAAPQRPSPRAQAQPQRRPVQQSLFSWEDDDEDTPRAQPAPRRPAAAVRGPAVMDGGGRPAIAPAAPPIVAYGGPQGAGTIVIDTRGRALYYVLGGGRAYRYPIAVGREGFTWTGTQTVSRIASWPDWRPPAEMRQRQPGLPELMTGGLRNPLGAKAIYLGSTLYRIHGTNDARSIGSASSSGCFRMTNANVMHLASLVRVGATVQVMRGLPARTIAAPASFPAGPVARDRRRGLIPARRRPYVTRQPAGRPLPPVPRDLSGGGKSGLHGSTVAANGRRGRPQGKCHREQTAAAARAVRGKGETVR